MMWYRETPFVLGDQKRAHLQVRGLSAGYGAFLVLRELRFEVKPGLTVILGPNGAGKSTLLKALMGLIPRSGMVLLDGEDLPEKTHEVVKGGVTLVAEGRQLFPQMTVLENLELGGWLVGKAERARRIEQVMADFPKLRERAQQLAGTMSGGEQQMLAIGRALMTQPKLLMLDEPSLGLAPFLVAEIFDIVRRINKEEGLSVLLVEQNAIAALEVVSHGYLIENGRVVMHDSAEAMKKNPDIQEFYLGGTEGRSFHDIKHYSRRKRWLT